MRCDHFFWLIAWHISLDSVRSVFIFLSLAKGLETVGCKQPNEVQGLPAGGGVKTCRKGQDPSRFHCALLW